MTASAAFVRGIVHLLNAQAPGQAPQAVEIMKASDSSPSDSANLCLEISSSFLQGSQFCLFSFFVPINSYRKGVCVCSARELSTVRYLLARVKVCSAHEATAVTFQGQELLELPVSSNKTLRGNSYGG